MRPGECDPAGDFEEKLIPSMDDFAEMCVRHDATEFLDASLIVPVAFVGMIELPVASAFYVALFRQAAEHALRHSCPMTYV